MEHITSFKTVAKLYYDYTWSQVDGSENWRHAKVGENGVIDIVEHEPAAPLERHYFEIFFEGGKMERIFNPSRVFYDLNI